MRQHWDNVTHRQQKAYPSFTLAILLTFNKNGKTVDMSTNVDDSPIARGKRLKKIRSLSGLSAEQLASRIGYSRQTISYWENATYSGLSHKGARRVIIALKEVNIDCDLSWLLYGVGNINGLSPEATAEIKQNWQVAENAQLLSKIAQPLLLQEIALFKQINKNAAVLQLTDAIKPLCERNDWIGGCFETVHSDLFGELCLVELEGQLQAKIPKQGGNTKTLILHSPYSSQQIQEEQSPIELKNSALNKIAKVVRLWKK